MEGSHTFASTDGKTMLEQMFLEVPSISHQSSTRRDEYLRNKSNEEFEYKNATEIQYD